MAPDAPMSGAAEDGLAAANCTALPGVQRRPPRFAISDDAVSFGRFARLFRDRLGCREALYLDGKVSRLWDPVAGRRDEGAAIGPIVVAVQRD